MSGRVRFLLLWVDHAILLMQINLCWHNKMKRLIKIIGLLILGVSGVVIKAIYLSTNNLYTLDWLCHRLECRSLAPEPVAGIYWLILIVCGILTVE